MGGIALLAVAVWLIFFEDEDEQQERLERNLLGWTFVVTALRISFDKFTVGFSIGLVGVRVALTIALIAFQSFVFTFFLGMTRSSHFW
jgi:manganese efflux pump family protein